MVDITAGALKPRCWETFHIWPKPKESRIAAMSQNKEENPVESVGVGCGKKGLGPRSGGKVKGIIRRGKSYILVLMKGGETEAQWTNRGEKNQRGKFG